MSNFLFLFLLYLFVLLHFPRLSVQVRLKGKTFWFAFLCLSGFLQVFSDQVHQEGVRLVAIEIKIIFNLFIFVLFALFVIQDCTEVVLFLFASSSKPALLLVFWINFSFHDKLFSISDFLDDFKSIFYFDILLNCFSIELIL